MATAKEEDSDKNSKSVLDSSESSSVSSEQTNELADNNIVLEQIRNLLNRRESRNNEARIRFLQWEREQKEAQEESKQFEAYWKRRHQEDKDLWRDKDFANAVDKMSRAGYKGEHGEFEVPQEIIQKLNALYMQITVGDYDGNHRLKFAPLWNELAGKSRIECQCEFIKLTNKAITTYGWNPPDGWQ